MLTVQIIGLQPLQQSVESFQKRWQDKSPLFEEGAQAYYKLVTERFIAGDQGRWRPLSDRRVQERGSDHPILVDTGDLYDAATMKDGTAGLGYIGADITGYKSITNNRMKLGLQGDKVQHNEGFVNDEGHRVPAREFWPLDELSGSENVFFTPFEKWIDGWLDGSQQIGFWGP